MNGDFGAVKINLSTASSTQSAFFDIIDTINIF